MKYNYKLIFIYLTITSPILNAMAHKNEIITETVPGSTATISLENHDQIETTQSIKKELIIAAAIGAGTGFLVAAIKNRDLFAMGLNILSSKIDFNKSK